MQESQYIIKDDLAVSFLEIIESFTKLKMEIHDVFVHHEQFGHFNRKIRNTIIVNNFIWDF
jgi:hypothetical protein